MRFLMFLIISFSCLFGSETFDKAFYEKYYGIIYAALPNDKAQIRKYFKHIENLKKNHPKEYELFNRCTRIIHKEGHGAKPRECDWLGVKYGGGQHKEFTDIVFKVNGKYENATDFMALLILMKLLESGNNELCADISDWEKIGFAKPNKDAMKAGKIVAKKLREYYPNYKVIPIQKCWYEGKKYWLDK